MGIQVYRDISVDFSNGRYIIMNAKQHDSKSRYIRLTCMDCGKKVSLNPDDHSAFIRYRKPDGYSAFNSCVISTDGTVMFELTEQMLSTVGTSYADLLIISVAKSDINDDLTIVSKDGRIIENNTSILSSMVFYINILAKPVDDWDITSSNEFSALNDLLIKATRDYEYIVITTKEYMENAKASENAARDYASKSETSASNAKMSEINARQSEENAYIYAQNAKESADLAKISESNSGEYADKAAESALSAEQSEKNSKESANKSNISETNAKQSELNAKESETNCKKNADLAKESADSAKISETNAKNYYEQLKQMNDTISSMQEAISELAENVKELNETPFLTFNE